MPPPGPTMYLVKVLFITYERRFYVRKVGERERERLVLGAPEVEAESSGLQDQSLSDRNEPFSSCSFLVINY